MLGPVVAGRVSIDMPQIPGGTRNDRLAAPRASDAAQLDLPPHPLPHLLVPPPIFLTGHLHSQPGDSGGRGRYPR